MILRILLLTLTAAIGTQAFGMQQMSSTLRDASQSVASAFNHAPLASATALALGTGWLIYGYKTNAFTSLVNKAANIKHTLPLLNSYKNNALNRLSDKIANIKNSFDYRKHTLPLLIGGTIGLTTGSLSHQLQKSYPSDLRAQWALGTLNAAATLVGIHSYSEHEHEQALLMVAALGVHWLLHILEID